MSAPCAPGEPGCDSGGATITSPAPAVPRASGSGSSGDEEPTLLTPIERNDTGSQAPGLNGPKSSGVEKETRAVPRVRKARRSDLRAAVEPFVNDPNDLFAPPKADRPWKYIVLHHSAHAAGGYAQIDRDHRENLGTQGCGYHFIVGNGTESPDGQIEVAKRWSDQKAGAHCRDPKAGELNDHGIGICLVGDLDQSEPTPRQIEATRALVAYLRERYTIRADHAGTHAQLAQTATACPGKHFPTDAILDSRGLAMR